MTVVILLQYPEHGFYGLVDKILLFKHNMESDNLLSLISSADEVNEGCLIEIVLSGKSCHITTKSSQLQILTRCTHIISVYGLLLHAFCNTVTSLIQDIFVCQTTFACMCNRH